MAFDPAWLTANFPNLDDLVPIGRGGQKEVLRGHDAVRGDVVLKLCHLGSDRARVLREIDAAQQLASARVPRIVDYGEVGSPVGMIIWLIEEYVEGVCLRDRLAAGGALPSNEVMHVGLGILDSLVAAEEARVVHRDVKPDNILVRSDGAVFLLDFGIARHLDLMSVTPSSAASGPCSPGYSPPEQFKNLKHDIDSRADIFALGVTLYECATGSNPYLADTTDVREVLRRVEASPLPPLRTDTGISVDLRDLIWAMTRLRRNHRPRSARECQSWLKQIRAVS